MSHPLSGQDVPQLRRAILSSPEGRRAYRLHAVLLVGRGLSCRRAAALIGASPRAVSYWVRRYRDKSVAGLEEKPHLGRRPRLSARELAELPALLSAPPPAQDAVSGRWTGAALRRHLQRARGVSLSVRQCQRLLRARPAPNDVSK